MDRKKKIIIAIIIFIFLGLTVFTFANTGDKNNEKNNVKENQQTETKKEPEENNSEEKSYVNEHGVVVNKTEENNIDNSYELALEAVKKAENLIDEDSYNKALDLVNKVTDETKKEELVDRLDEVKQGIDAKILVETLENKTNSSANKDDLDLARNYRIDEDIINIISNLSNEELKNDLQAKLTELSKILDDITLPEINIEDEAILSSDTQIITTDENEVTIILSKEGEEDIEIESGTELSDGIYSINVVDAAFNEVTISFTIDTKAPEFNIEDGFISSDTLNIIVDDLTLENVEVTNTITGVNNTYTTSNIEIYEEGTYTLTATDKTGRSTTITVTVDKTLPEVVSATQIYETKENGRIKVTVVFSEKIEYPFDKLNWRKISDTEYYTYFYNTKNYKINFKDLAGNNNSYTINIDKTAPEVVSTTQVYEAKEGGRIKTTVVFSEEVEYPFDRLNWRKVSGTEYYTYFYTTKDYTIDFKDLVGNPNSYTLNIDADAPIVYLNSEKVTDVKYYKENVTVKVEDEKIDSVVITKDGSEILYTDNMVLTEEGKYVITAQDKSNSKTEITFYIDKTAPRFQPEEWGYTLEADKNATFTCPDMTDYVTDDLSGVNSVTLDTWYATYMSIPDQTKPGNFRCRYISTDNAGNTISNDIYYSVVDTTAPIVTLNGDSSINLVGGVDNYVEEYATVTDNVDDTINNLEPAYINHYNFSGVFQGRVNSVDTSIEGKYNLVYFVKDSSNNESVKITRSVTVTFPTSTNKVLMSTANALLDLANNTSNYTGKEIVLTKDIDLSGIDWTPINSWSGVLNGTVIDGNGHSIKNMTVSTSEQSAGFISSNASSITIKNLTFDNANIEQTSGSSKYAGVVMGKNYSPVTLENVKVINSSVKNNWQAGGLVGFAEGNAPRFVNCSIEDSFVGGENATAGTLFGLGIVDVEVVNSSAKNVRLYTDMPHGTEGYFAGYLYGRTLTTINSFEENVTIVDSY